MKTCPHCGESLDGRGIKWRVRVRLYTKGDSEPIADSDDDRPAGAPGATVIRSLTAVAEHVRHLVLGFHTITPDETTGLDMPTLQRRVRAFRPTLSRHAAKGDAGATLRIPYTVVPERADRGRPYPHDYTARVDVERV